MKAKFLGKLKGIIASAKEDSRNVRKYTENFWDSIFNSDLFIEGIQNKMFFGELYHPEDIDEYSQIHPDDRSAVVLESVEKKGKEYYGTFNILPTRAGEVLKNLVDLGCVFGVSSRGLSDTNTNYFDDPSTYELITFDIVAFPGIKSARLHPIDAVSESILSNNKDKVKIQENLNKLVTDNSELKKYVDNALKLKENFDEDIQIEEIINEDEFEYENMLNSKNTITTDAKGNLWFNDGIHGKHIVDYYKKLKPETKYYINDIYYNDTLDRYIIITDVIEL